MKARMNIKNIIMVMATICLASMFFINICFATNTGKITTETARLREQPQTDSKVLELASLGEEVEILEEVDGWYKVKYKNITGYIRADLIEVNNKEENAASNETTQNSETENTPTENANTQETSEIENNNTETNVSESEETTLEKGKYKLFENAKLKIIPLINALELGEINKDTEVEVTEVLNEWAKIKTADGKEGWVIRRRTASTGEIVVLFELLENADNATNETTNNNTATGNETTNNTDTSNNQPENVTKTMYVNSQTINVRQKADKSSQVIKQLSINTQVTVISTDNGWAYVDINGTKGYIAENLLSSTKKETSRSAMTERSTTNSQTQTTTAETNAQTTTTANATTANTQTTKTTASNAQKTENTTSGTTTSTTGSSVVAYAQQFLGCKYVYGGTTTSGFDCSGFTQFVYKHFGVNLNRTAAAQYSNGTAVTNLQAGDLVMFGKSGINHVGIYIGGNTFIHAANPSRGVTTDTLASGYYKTNYVGARRIF